MRSQAADAASKYTDPFLLPRRRKGYGLAGRGIPYWPSPATFWARRDL